jgi:hypothetical protein
VPGKPRALNPPIRVETRSAEGSAAGSKIGQTFHAPMPRCIVISGGVPQYDD